MKTITLEGPKQEEKAPEQTEFTVTLEGVAVPGNKLAVIKVWRELTNQGLKESKDSVEAALKVVKEGCSKQEAKTLKEKLEAVGATVTIK